VLVWSMQHKWHNFGLYESLQGIDILSICLLYVSFGAGMYSLLHYPKKTAEFLFSVPYVSKQAVLHY